ncbi:MAG: inositol monophosphatase [Haloplasmataceae bacterium]|jgi:3'(2'), 5'-bisphosphate nucleotidase|nr:inositol monophosphatase [Haloplasmataceae bacterium]
MDFSKELYEAKKVAITAGKAIMEIYHNDFTVDYKDDFSPVTKADLLADNIILTKLKEAFPNHAFLSEESADDLSRLDNDYCFIIDPIDGTTEFISKSGEFTVNIGLAYKHEMVMGVIYVPVLDELYYAEKGKGAYKVKDRVYTKLNVSKRTGKIRVAESRAHKTKSLSKLYEENVSNIEKVYEVGSTLKGCYLASGILDAFYKFGLGTKEWDVAAMAIIVEEAGGIFNELNHNKMLFNKADVRNVNGYYVINKEENLFSYKHLL